MAVNNPLEGLRGAPPKIAREPVTGKVTKIDADGIWVVPLEGDQRIPVGPCRGADTVTVDDVCLVVWTQERPWAYVAEATPSGPAGGVLAGTYPAPTFAEDMATQAELDEGLAGKVDATDPRLSDARAPLTHQHEVDDVIGLQSELDGKVDVDDSRLSDARPPTPHQHPLADVAGLQDALAGLQAISERGQANGYATLDPAGKIPLSQLPGSVMTFEGVWNAATNTPPLADGTGDPGMFYRVGVAGTRNLGSGTVEFAVGDYVICNTAFVWEKSDGTDGVTSVAGKTGAVTLTKADVGLNNVDNISKAALLQEFLLAAHPVGCIYESENSTHPSILFGGTWQTLGPGTFLVAVDPNDPDFDTPGKTGGEKDHLLTAAESGLRAHDHPVTVSGTNNFMRWVSAGGNTAASAGTQQLGQPLTVDVGANAAANAQVAHNNLPPFRTVYRWKRTA